MTTSREPRKSGKKSDERPWWINTLAGIGGVAVVSVIVTLFFSFGRRPTNLIVKDVPEVGTPEFLSSIAGMAGGPIRAGGSVEYLPNGDAFFPRLLADFKGAKKTINLLVYIWEDGKISDQVIAVLKERAQAGVKVRILLDGLGAMKAPDDKMKDLEKAGAKVSTFRAAQLGKLTRFHKRDHRRSIVIDGLSGFTGGEAIADKWIGNADTEEHWRDSMFRVTGPLAATVQSAFCSDWAFTTGEMLTGPDYFPPEGLDSAPGASTMLHTGVASAPSNEDYPLRLFFVQTFAAARHKLYITTPYFVPDESMRRVVADRARAGVDVRILLPDEHTDAKLIRRTSHSYFDDLLSAGVKIYEYQPTMMHGKSVVVDGKWSVVGSANMDVRSKELNHENVLGILDAPFAATLEQAFKQDLAKSEEIKLDEWRKRGPWAHFMETIGPMFAEQY